jgi:replicative DNA helicase
MEVLADSNSEHSIIGCLIKNGPDAFFDSADMLSINTFTDITNSSLFKIIKTSYETDVKVLDAPLILSLAKQEKLDTFIKIKDIKDKINTACELSSLQSLVAKIRKLEIARILHDELENRRKTIEGITGGESINNILANIEFNLDSLFNNVKQTKKMGDGLKARLKELADNPVTQVGLSTGYPIYDAAIGGGLRGGSVNVVGARIKVGKSHFLNNIALNTSKNNIKVLYLDTEMKTEEQENRCVSNLAEVDINLIETGVFGEKEATAAKIYGAADKLTELPYEHINVSGMPFEEQISIMSRWLRKNQVVKDGKVAECIIIYDYLKLTSSDGINSNLAEYQLLGFMITTLHNLSVRYDIPIMTAVQLNRDGIDKESTGVAAGSDRILWLCSNFSIFKFKSPEELALDPIENGNRKLVIMAARHGPGLSEFDYINFLLDTYKCKLMEGKLRSQNVKK